MNKVLGDLQKSKNKAKSKCSNVAKSNVVKVSSSDYLPICCDTPLMITKQVIFWDTVVVVFLEFTCRIILH